MVASGLSLYAGSAVALGLFVHFSPLVVAWFRVAAAGVILVIARRPPLRSFYGRQGAAAAVYGVTTMAMNMMFYQAISHVAMGTVVALEFLGPVVVAALASRSRRDLVAIGLAMGGVVIISGDAWGAHWRGICWALGAGALWALYIVFGSHIAADATTSRASLPVGFFYAGLVGLPGVLLLWPEDLSVPGAEVVGLACALGVLSAAIPYSLDQLVLRMAGAGFFALLQAILPVVAAIVGAVALRQWLSVAEVVGIVTIVAAIVVRSLQSGGTTAGQATHDR